MSITNRIIDKIPMLELWDSNSVVIATNRIKYLKKSDISELLGMHRVQFVVADIGLTLEWLNQSECFTFWKMIVKDHIPDNLEKIDLASFPDHYAFLASQWITDHKDVIVLLEKMH